MATIQNVIDQTAVTQSPGNNTTLIATTAFVTNAVSSAGGIGFPGYASGNYYSNGFFGTPGAYTGSQSIATSLLYFRPFFCWATHTFSSLSIYCATASAGNVNLGIYATSNGQPTGSALYTSGNMSTSTTGAKTYTTSISLTGNTWYWFALACSSTSPAFTAVQSILSVDNNISAPLGSTSLLATNSALIGYQMSFVYSATLPSVSGLSPIASPFNQSDILMFIAA